MTNAKKKQDFLILNYNLHANLLEQFTKFTIVSKRFVIYNIAWINVEKMIRIANSKEW